jgi:transcription antitermination factor NusG
MPWFVIYTKSRNEKKVAELLQKNGVEVFCPLVKLKKNWSDRTKIVETPLFNSYVFVNLSEKDRNVVFNVPGVIRYLFWLKKPAIVKDSEIESLKSVLHETMDSFTIENYQIGETIKISEGVFKGLDGVIEKQSNNKLHVILENVGIKITLQRS